MRRRIRSLSSPAGWTEAPLAREGQKSLEPARGATDTSEAVRQNSAAQIATKLLLDEVRISCPAPDSWRSVASSRKVSRLLLMIAYRAVASGVRRWYPSGTGLEAAPGSSSKLIPGVVSVVVIGAWLLDDGPAWRCRALAQRAARVPRTGHVFGKVSSSMYSKGARIGEVGSVHPRPGDPLGACPGRTAPAA